MRGRRGPPGSSTRPSARPSSSSATTGTSTRSTPAATGRPMSCRRRHPAGGRSSWTRTDRTVAVPPGVHLDLGATAKALAADRAADRIADALGCGVLVNLGGDVAVSGSAPDRRVGRRHRRRRARRSADAVDQVVHPLTPAAWPRPGPRRGRGYADGRTVHHIVDPWTGDPAAPVWSLVSTAGGQLRGGQCLEHGRGGVGDDAVGTWPDLGVPARLVAPTGSVVHVGDWPRTTRPARSSCRRRRRGRRRRRTGCSDARHLLDHPLVHHPGHRHRGPGAADRDHGASGSSPPGGRRSRSWPAVRPAPTCTSGCRCWPWCSWPSTCSPRCSTPTSIWGGPSIVVPFASPYRPLWTGLGTVAVDLMVAVAVSSALRQRISARTWRGIHWLAYGSWPVAMAHALGEGTDGLQLWMDVLAARVRRGGGRSLWPGGSPTTGGSRGRAVPGRRPHPGRPRPSDARRPRRPAGSSTGPPESSTVRTGRGRSPDDRNDREHDDPRIRRPASSPARPARSRAGLSGHLADHWRPRHPGRRRSAVEDRHPRSRRPVRTARSGWRRLPVRRQVAHDPIGRPAGPWWWSTPWRASRPAPRTACC